MGGINVITEEYMFLDCVVVVDSIVIDCVVGCVCVVVDCVAHLSQTH